MMLNKLIHSTKSPYQIVKVLKRALNKFIFLYNSLNQVNLYVNSMISIIILIYESGTYDSKWLRIVQMYGEKVVAC